MVDKTLNGWLGLFLAVCRMAHSDMNPADWMIRVRSAGDLEFVLSLMLGVRSMVAMRTMKNCPRGEGSTWEYRRWRGAR